MWNVKRRTAYHGDGHVCGHARVVRDAPRLVRVVEDETGVDRAGARRTWEPVERRQPHGRVDGFAVFNGAR